MSKPHSLLQVLALLACCGLAACGRNDAVAQTTPSKPYEQPPGWSSECFGRFVVDVPGRLEFGNGGIDFGQGRQDGRYATGDGSMFGGGVGIASNLVRETAVLRTRKDFSLVLMQADGYHETQLIRDG